MVCWMADAPLREGGRYLLKHTTRTVQGRRRRPALPHRRQHAPPRPGLRPSWASTRSAACGCARARRCCSTSTTCQPHDRRLRPHRRDDARHGRRGHGHLRPVPSSSTCRSATRSRTRRRRLRGRRRRVISRSMVARGDLFGEGPGACPFVALDYDRDRRSDQPDYRHRCYAEPMPAPRAMAHQEAYCLSPNFPGCPDLPGLGRPAAARPVPAARGYEGRPRTGRCACRRRCGRRGGAAAAADRQPVVARCRGCRFCRGRSTLRAGETTAQRSPSSWRGVRCTAAGGRTAVSTEAEPLVESMPSDRSRDASPAFDDERRSRRRRTFGRRGRRAAAATAGRPTSRFRPAEPVLAPSTASPDDEPRRDRWRRARAGIPRRQIGTPARRRHGRPSQPRGGRALVGASTDRYGAQAGGDPPDERSSGDGTFSRS